MRKLLPAVAFSGAALLVAAQPSQASLMLSLTDGTNTQSLTDTAGTGVLSFLGSVGAFALNFTSGSSKPATGTATSPDLDLLSVNVTAWTAGTLTIALSDVGFIGAGGLVSFMDAVSGFESAGTLAVNTYMDCGNAAFGKTTQLSSQSFGSASISGNASNTVNTCTGNYSLTQIAVLSMPAFAISGFTSDLTDPPSGGGSSIPEPATITLFGAALLGWLGFDWMRRRREAV